MNQTIEEARASRGKERIKITTLLPFCFITCNTRENLRDSEITNKYFTLYKRYFQA